MGVGCHVSSVHGHDPRVRGVLTERPSSRRLLPLLEFECEFAGNVLCGVVVCVHRVRTVKTGETLPFAGVVKCTATLRALLARVRGFGCLNHDAAFLGFARGLFLQRTKCLLLELFAVADALSNLLQVFERDVRTAVAFRLWCNFFGTSMQVVLAPAPGSISDTVVGQVGASRAGLLQTGTAFLELTALVVEVVGVADEPSCTGHSDVVVNVAVHAKDSRTLGFLRTARVSLVLLPRGAKTRRLRCRSGRDSYRTSSCRSGGTRRVVCLRGRRAGRTRIRPVR